MSSASPTLPSPPSLARALANVLRDTFPVRTGVPLSAAFSAWDKRLTCLISLVRAWKDPTEERTEQLLFHYGTHHMFRCTRSTIFG